MTEFLEVSLYLAAFLSAGLVLVVAGIAAVVEIVDWAMGFLNEVDL